MIAMILNVERYRYQRRGRKPRLGWLVLLVIAVVAGAGLLAWRFGAGKVLSRLVHPQARSQSLAELWKNRLYDEIIANCDQTLRRDPLAGEALVYRGFSFFYKAVSESNLEDRIPFLDEAIGSLRRSRLAKDSPWPAETDYVLGKAYYHKGKYYYDLTLEYLKKALAAGYESEDIYDYMGLAATQLEQPEQGLEYFQKALDKHPTDILLLMIAQSYHELGQTRNAEEYLLRAINKTEDPAIEKKSRFLLGQIYYDRKEYLKAADEYQAILAQDADSADAHFYLGEVYSSLNDPVKARSEWRKTLIIDPSHYGAKLRYYR
jgi:tetratricopeptide (TPR) repeat protein